MDHDATGAVSDTTTGKSKMNESYQVKCNSKFKALTINPPVLPEAFARRSKIVLLFEILPPPPKKGLEIKKGKEKAGTANILTASPYKTQLELVLCS